MVDSEVTLAADETAINGSLIERVADEAGLDPGTLADALVVLHAELLSQHSTYERRYDYVTVDGTRAYRVPDDEWETLGDLLGFDDGLIAPTRYAHTEQARLLFAKTPGGDDNFDPDEAGVVVGIDTAEQF